MVIKHKKESFFKKKCEKVWWLHKKSVPLHPQIRNRPLQQHCKSNKEEPRRFRSSTE